MIDSRNKARAIHLARAGNGSSAIARLLGMTRQSVAHWLKQFRKQGLITPEQGRSRRGCGFWTEEKISRAMAGRKAGYSFSRIAEDTGAPSRNAISGIFYRLAHKKTVAKVLVVRLPGPPPPAPPPTIYTGNACTTPDCRNQRMRPWGHCSICQRGHMPDRLRDHMAEVV